jgi:glycosyltransferase involved in cell wall biosynthesis
LLVAPESAVGFAEAIEKLLADPSLGVRLAQAARKKVEEFDEHRVLEKWNEVIHEAIQPLS